MTHRLPEPEMDAVKKAMKLVDEQPAFNRSDYQASLKDMAASAQIDRYGIALMMIREGCDDPQKVAREALAAYGR